MLLFAVAAVYLMIGGLLTTYYHFKLFSKEYKDQLADIITEYLPDGADRNRFMFLTLLWFELEYALLWPKYLSRTIYDIYLRFLN